MHHRHIWQPDPVRERRVRILGFDPLHLTPDEQTELLQLHTDVASRLTLISGDGDAAPGQQSGEEKDRRRVR